jgi:hypothetical protein
MNLCTMTVSHSSIRMSPTVSFAWCFSFEIPYIDVHAHVTLPQISLDAKASSSFFSKFKILGARYVPHISSSFFCPPSPSLLKKEKKKKIKQLCKRKTVILLSFFLFLFLFLRPCTILHGKRYFSFLCSYL